MMSCFTHSPRTLGLHKGAGRWIDDPQRIYDVMRDMLNQKQVGIEEAFWMNSTDHGTLPLASVSALFEPQNVALKGATLGVPFVSWEEVSLL